MERGATLCCHISANLSTAVRPALHMQSTVNICVTFEATITFLFLHLADRPPVPSTTTKPVVTTVKPTTTAKPVRPTVKPTTTAKPVGPTVKPTTTAKPVGPTVKPTTPKPTTTAAPSTKTTRPIPGRGFCKGKPDGIYANPEDAASFYTCFRGMTYLNHCGLGSVFDDSCKCCNWPRDALPSLL